MRADYLGECNSANVPERDFTLTFCNRCLQQECTRSLVGKSRLEQRVQDWEEKLFVNPSRLEPSDLRFAGICAKRFLHVQPSIELRGSWIDPKDLGENQSSTMKAAVIPSPSPVPLPPDADRPASEPPGPPDTDPDPAPPVHEMGNTAFRHGQMLATAPKAPTAFPVYNPPQQHAAKVVKPGARIRMG